MSEEDRREILEQIEEGEEKGFACRVFTAVPVGKNAECILAAVGTDGAFLILRAEDPDTAWSAIPEFHLTGHTFIWMENGEGFFYLDSQTEELLPVSDIVSSFLGVYFGIRSGQVSEKSAREAACREAAEIHIPDTAVHSPSISEERYEVICAAFQKRLEEKEQPGIRRDRTGRCYREVDGVLYLGRKDLFGRDRWYPVSRTEDPGRLLGICAAAGFVGAHKFAEKRILQGILYAVTLGLGGTLWICDLVSMLLGNYQLKDGSYLGRVEKSRKTLLAVLCGLGIGTAVLLASWAGLRAIGNSLSVQVGERTAQWSEETAEDAKAIQGSSKAGIAERALSQISGGNNRAKQ